MTFEARSVVVNFCMCERPFSCRDTTGKLLSWDCLNWKGQVTMKAIYGDNPVLRSASCCQFPHHVYYGFLPWYLKEGYDWTTTVFIA